MKHKLVCIVGMCGSGKSVLADALVERGYDFVRFGQIVLDEIKKRGEQPSEALEKEIREAFRKKHGMAAFAILNKVKFDAGLAKGNVVGDGLYSWDEYKILKEAYGDQMVVVAVYAPPLMRYNRLEKRFSDEFDTDLRNRGFTKEEARSRDYSEIENLAKGGPIAMADYLIVNTGSMKKFEYEIQEFIEELEEDDLLIAK